MPHRQGSFQIECHRDDLDGALVAAIADATLTTVTDLLGLDRTSVRGVRVIVASDGSSVVDREIRVSPRAAGRGYSVYDWFELLFAHELTHLLVRDAWGLPPVLWWEGLPVHLGDDRIRTRLFGRSYHQYCSALDELGHLLPLAPLLRASTYYRRRADVRVDLQAGSFCGFVLQRCGPQRLARFIAEAPRPRRDPGDVIVDPASRRWLGDDLAGLGAAWVRFLRAEEHRDAMLVEELRGRRFGGEPDGRLHCDDCFTPRSIATCPGCLPPP